MTFCTVHANNSILTNITVKSILKFHPDAKVFVSDITKLGTFFTDQFVLIDDDIQDNVEVIYGVTKDNVGGQMISIPRQFVPSNVLEIIGKTDTTGDTVEIPVINDGDIHHSINIQFAMDVIGENFVLVDNDAPLIHPVDFYNEQFGTVCDIESWSLYLDSKHVTRICNQMNYRFSPVIQYMNVDYMKSHGIDYCTEKLFAEEYECAIFLNKNWGYGLHYPTGSLMFSQYVKKKSNFIRINHENYVDHLGGGTWDWKKKDEVAAFMLKYKYMFENTEFYDECFQEYIQRTSK